jgi:hypothetical protein
LNALDLDFEKQEIEWAREIKEQNPETCKNYTVEEVRRIWKDHSSDLFAGWLGHGKNQEQIEAVFRYYHKIDGKIMKEIDR